jgi:mannonate dehydratase
MEQTWRWFGMKDKVTLSSARQAGAEGIVTALHEAPIGNVWTQHAIRDRQQMIEAAGMRWSVVESLDVSERIKLREPGFQQDIDNYIASLRNLASCGIRVIAYNLMPVLTWMRTELQLPLPTGGFTVAYDATAFASFDLFILKRHDAEGSWSDERCRAAKSFYDSLSETERGHLQSVILQGLPGGSGSFSMEDLRHGIKRYRGVDAAAFRANIGEFLRQVCPVAEELGLRLCVHPDDPPRALLGLPRIVSTADDLEFLLEQSPEPANGITFCTGALGVRADNSLVDMAKQFAARIWFAHLRSTERLSDPESFFEAAHLEGDADVIGVMHVLFDEEQRRLAKGDRLALPYRADHGQQLLNDVEQKAQAGYPAVGRLRGLAELRGVQRTLERLHAAPRE